MRVLIVGGAGFIGLSVVQNIQESGWEPTVIDNSLNFPHNKFDQSLQQNLIVKDILTLQPSDLDGRFDSLIHLAAIPSVSSSWRDLYQAHQHNLSTTVKVMELCRQLQIPKLIFASSAAVYGDSLLGKKYFLNERRTLSPQSPYGLQKKSSEEYLTLVAPSLDLQVVTLRLFNVYGYKAISDLKGQDVISIFTRKAFQNEGLTIFGDGQQQRDFIHVQDVARAFRLALSRPRQSTPVEVFNIGVGQGRSLLDVIDILRGHFPDWQHQPCFQPSRRGDIAYSVAAVERAKQELGFEAQISLSEGIALLIHQLRQNAAQ